MSERRLRYDPALDGLRGVAVALVLVFHGGFVWAQGGFLGVSVFFTLSGFLITSLLLAETDASGSVHLSHFWVRRVRRLMPAALACVALVLLLTATVLASARDTLRGDVVATLLDVANWRFYFSGQSYAQLFAVPSPLQHFWSLAIEEQFYVVFPLLVWLVVVKLHRSRRTLAVVLGALLVASVATSIAVGRSDPDLDYYATFSRAAELLTGCLLAFAVRAWGRADPDRHRAWWPIVVGPVALVALFAIVHGTAQSDTWLYRGGLAAFSLVSVALIASARRPGPLRWTLSTKPLVGLGLISYGVYLYHWPLFLWLTPDRTGLDGWALFGVRVAVTLAVAIVSYVLLEQPIRRGRALTGARAALAPPIAIACLVAVAIPLGVQGAAASATGAFTGSHATSVTLPPLAPSTTTSPPPTTDAPPPTAPATTTASTVAPPPATTLPPAPVRIVVFGDSTAKADAAGLIPWGTDTGRALVSDAGTIPGCGVVRAAKRIFGTAPQAIPSGCMAWTHGWPDVLAANPADVAVVVDGPWELVDHQLAGDKWRALGDPVYDQHVHDDLLLATDTLLAHVSKVVWVVNPITHAGWPTADAAKATDARDAQRMERLNEIIRQLAVDRPEIALVDLGGHLDAIPGADTDHDLRPDGVHFSVQTSRQVADWLGPAILAASGHG